MELLRALAVLAEPPRPETDRLAALLGLVRAPSPEDYARLFLFELYPFASVYLGAEGMLGGEARDRVAGFWRALGEDPPAEPDHLAVLLALYARLLELEATEPDAARRAAAGRARAALLWEHLLSWLPIYLDALSELASAPYDAWGRLLTETLEREARSVPAPPRLPLHLREAPALADPEGTDGDDFLTALLAPVRSGMVLTRADVARAARNLGLGLRAGERLYSLRAMAEQDPGPLFQWLEAEAVRWRARHERRIPTLGAVAGFWAERARRTEAALRAAARRVGGSAPR
jgi:TorA maturation chaperone TorD